MTAAEALNDAVKAWLDQCGRHGFTPEQIEATEAAWDEEGAVPPVLRPLFQFALCLQDAQKVATQDGRPADWQIDALFVMRLLKAAGRLVADAERDAGV